MSAEDAVAAVQTESFTKIVSFAPLEDDVSPADVLDGAMRLIQAVGAKPVAERPALFFCTRATQMKDQVNIPMHAGVWGLARTARVEYEGAEIGCVDVAANGEAPAEQLKRAATKCGQPAY